MLAFAHEIKDADARDVSSCFQRVSNRFENVWPSLRRTHAVKDHVFDSLLPASVLGSSTLDEAESASLAVSQKVVNGKRKNSTIKVCKIEVAYLTETFIFLNIEYSLTLEWTQPPALKLQRHHNDDRFKRFKSTAGFKRFI